MIIRAVPVSASAQIAGTPKRYAGFTLRETSKTSDAIVRIWGATTATGTVLDSISLAAGESAREYYQTGIVSDGQTGIYFEVVSGTVLGSVRVEA